MIRALQTSFGGSALSGNDLDNIAKTAMASNLSTGKGVNSGLVISAGTGLNVNVSAGVFTAQVKSTIPSSFVIAVPASYTGYLFIQAPLIDTDPPDSIHQTTTADPGSTYVCLGYFATSGSAVTSVDPSQADVYGGSSLAANLATAAPKAVGGKLTAAGGFGANSSDVTLAHVTLNSAQGANEWQIVTGTPGAARNLILPSVVRSWDVTNGSDSTVTFKAASGTGIAVASGKSARVGFNGTNVIRLSADV